MATITGTSGDDILTGTDGDDSIIGLAGDDSLSGAGGNDSLEGGGDFDELFGGSGDDSLDGGAGNDQLDGGSGTNAASYASATAPVNVDLRLAGTAQNTIGAGSDTLIDIQGLTGSNFNDVLTGDALANILFGGGGADRLGGEDGDDSLNGGAGDDRLIGGNGNDLMIGGGGNDIADYSAAEAAVTVKLDLSGQQDTLGAGLDTLVDIGRLIGSEFGDLLVGNAGANVLNGLGGDDTLDGGAGSDAMIGGIGNDTYNVDNSGDTILENTSAGIDIVSSSISFTLGANLENLSLTDIAAIDGTGNSGANVITGNSAINVLTGGGGNDTLDGAGGADTMDGGLGNDIYIVDNSGDRVIEAAASGIDLVRSSVGLVLRANVENLALTGTGAINGGGNALANILIGNSAANSLSGYDGDDTLDGGLGADTLNGGLGNDVYKVDNVHDRIIETSAAGGTDLVMSSVGFALGTNVENLTLTGAASINGLGNYLNNVMIGNAGNNVLNGNVGSDRMEGGAGNDSYIVDNEFDVVVEGAAAGTDKVTSAVSFTLGANIENLTLAGSAALDGTGNILANWLIGNVGDNILDGRNGADRMQGGLGDDTYLVENVGDVVVEQPGAGHDTVRSSKSFVLSSNVEDLVLTGNQSVNGTGNMADNVLTGNDERNTLDGRAGADQMFGGGGEDTYHVDNIGDVVSDSANGFEEADRVVASISYVLGSDIEALELVGTANLNGTGNGGPNSLEGNAGNNRLDGLGGQDFMHGGAGDDIFVVATAGDIAQELVDQGTDTVESSISYTLGSNVENLALTGHSAINGTGNTLDNNVTGNDAANALEGHLGADFLIGGGGDDILHACFQNDPDTTELTSNTLAGGLGNDLLTGSDGSDEFRFDSAFGPANVDDIVDFASGVDSVTLDNAVFTGLSDGALPAGAFVVGTAAGDVDDRIIHDPATGSIYFDEDGTGAIAAILFATVDPGLSIAASDFIVF